jgi:anti-sigma-K factor RskA
MNGHVDESIGAYALGALEPAEQAEVERHLAVCSHCQAELEITEENLGLLALSLEPITPFPELKDRILTAARVDQIPPRTEQPADPENVIPEPIPIESRRPRFPRYVMPALAVAAVVLIVAGVLVNRSQQQNAQQQYAAYVSQARSHGDTVIVLKPINHAAAEATLAVTKSGQASLIVGPSSPPPSQKVYQLWYMNLPATRAVTVFRTSKDHAQVLKLHLSPHGYKLTGVTAEPGPNGSPKPTSNPILVGTV